mmetsp:Transcript_22166/g.43103  ORF Transcript_22166/g.43103 Transcript_22166/m.43103 type:complete len:460 (+) Transcript_22166:25-1404(+)
MEVQESLGVGNHFSSAQAEQRQSIDEPPAFVLENPESSSERVAGHSLVSQGTQETQELEEHGDNPLGLDTDQFGESADEKDQMSLTLVKPGNETIPENMMGIDQKTHRSYTLIRPSKVRATTTKGSEHIMDVAAAVPSSQMSDTDDDAGSLTGTTLIDTTIFSGPVTKEKNGAKAKPTEMDSIQSESSKDLKSKGVSKNKAESKLVIAEEATEPTDESTTLSDKGEASESVKQQTVDKSVKKAPAKKIAAGSNTKATMAARYAKLPESKKATIKKTRGKVKPGRTLRTKSVPRPFASPKSSSKGTPKLRSLTAKSLRTKGTKISPKKTKQEKKSKAEKIVKRPERKIASVKSTKKKSLMLKKNMRGQPKGSPIRGSPRKALAKKSVGRASNPTPTKAMGAGIEKLVKVIVTEQMELWEEKMMSRIEELVEERLSNLMYPPDKPPRLIPESKKNNVSYIS